MRRHNSSSGLQSHPAEMDAPTNCPQVVPIYNGARAKFIHLPYHWQIEAWEAMVGKRQDIIVIAATGSGKSRIFHCLHFGRDGAVTLVISPLLSLINDQVLHFIFPTFR